MRRSVAESQAALVRERFIAHRKAEGIGFSRSAEKCQTSCGRCSRRGFGNGHNAPAGPNACMLGIRLTDGCYRGCALWHPLPRASGASEGGNSRKAAVSDGKAADAARGPDSPFAAGRTAGDADRLLCTAYTAAGGKPCAAASRPPCGGVCVLCGMRGVLRGCSLPYACWRRRPTRLCHILAAMCNTALRRLMRRRAFLLKSG